MEFKLDENGKISDSDIIFDKLDKLEENDDYESMIRLVTDIPNEHRSLKLRFTLISAMVNKGDYSSAINELLHIYPDCKKQSDLAQLFYYSGYAVSNLRKNHILGLSLLKDAFAADPKNELGLDIEDECRRCAEEIDAQLADFGKLCGTAASDIMRLCREAKDEAVFEGRGLLPRLAFLKVFRMAPGLSAPLSLDDFTDKPEGTDKAMLASWLNSAVGVTDHNSILELFRKGRSFNLSPIAEDVTAFIAGKPKFDIDILDQKSRSAFKTYTMLVECFARYLPKPGVLAWDIAKRIAVLRFAYAAEVISADDYINTLDELTDSVKSFSGAEEFLLSLTFGSAFASFDAESTNLSAAFRSIGITMGEISSSGLPGSVWIL